LVEFLWFGVKEARACLFAGLFFLAVFGVPRAGVLGIPRYDLLLIIALAIQAWMVRAKLETWDELKAITLFHVIGFGLEVFKTSGAIRSWSYPDFAYTKLFGVPLFSGFMYAAVGSYIIQSWRLFDVRIRHHPPYWMAGLVALLIYANFFTLHYIPDLRWYLAALALGLYARTTVVFRPLDRDRTMPARRVSADWIFHLAGREHQHVRRDLAIPEPAGRVDFSPRRQVELVVAAGGDDVYDRCESQAHQGARACPGLSPILNNPRLVRRRLDVGTTGYGPPERRLSRRLPPLAYQPSPRADCGRIRMQSHSECFCS